jgi:ribosomal protein S12 methylthiotransferase
MPGQVPTKTKRERYDRLMRAQQSISLAINRSYVGQTLPILVDEIRDGWIAGRSFRDAPEIDGWVYAQGTAEPGSFAKVTVTEAQLYDLYGHLEGVEPSKRRQLSPLRMSAPAKPQ